MRRIVYTILLLALLCGCTARVRPARMSEMETRPAPLRWVTYTDPDHGFSLNYPVNWSAEMKEGRLTLNGPADEEGYAPTVVVQVLASAEYGDVVEAMAAVLDQASAADNYKLISEGYSIIDGEPAREVVITFSHDAVEMKQNNLFLQDPKTGTICIIGYPATAESYPRHIDAYEMVKGTFRFG